MTPLEALHRDHFTDLVRLAELLLGDRQASEDAVQDAFSRVYQRREVDLTEAGLRYLRVAVINAARSALRRRRVRDRLLPFLATSAVDEPAQNDSRNEVIKALRRLPQRQRECLALRYYGDLSNEEAAITLGIAVGSVKTHVHRGIAALRFELEELR